MSSLETSPTEVQCGGDGTSGPAPVLGAAGSASTPVEVIAPREVPLGGPRAMTVRRTLPARGRTMIGAWCFVDHYGPDDITESGGMVVPPHPHTALQTVSWLFSGVIEHRDSTGVRAQVRPGELNLMTAGHGVCHSEVSVTDAGAPTVLHGAQLWVALPQQSVAVEPSFAHHAPEPVAVDGDGGQAGTVSVFLGSLGLPDGRRIDSPVRTHTPLLGAEIRLAPGARLRLEIDPRFEHGVLGDEGAVEVDGTAVERSHLAYLPPGPDALTVSAGRDGARALLLGGPPFGERIVMWWNFIGRSHDEIVAARERWQAELGHEPGGRFGAVDYPGESLPAPDLPQVRLRPRG